jgi:hypothetical protein
MWDVIFKVERIEKSVLAIRLKTHHGNDLRSFDVHYFINNSIKIERSFSTQ